MKSDRLEAEEDLRRETELRDEQRVTEEQIEQQVVNQGMDTGTHSSEHLGVDWGPSYRVRPEIAPSTTNRIAARAYELYLQRGREDGHDVEDWLAAEKELLNN